MQLVQTNSSILHKTQSKFTSVARSTSCSHGWLRVVIQHVFGAITVTSFILIVILSVTNHNSMRKPTRCKPSGCRIVCIDAPYFDKYEEEIFFAMADIGMRCDRVMLTLNYPMFTNGTLPSHWMSTMRVPLYELEIIGGNLINIEPQAFMSEFTSSIQSLSLKHVTVSVWSQEMLVGLASLEVLNIQNSNIELIERNALEAVDNTLRTLSITVSGNLWDPVNLTGSSNLEALNTVVLSKNNFNSILQERSFDRLYHCKKLYLNSCRIIALGSGVFDNLHEIEVIYLNNNYLKELPPGIFDNIFGLTNPRPRINLVDNLWHCDCSNRDLRRLTAEGLLLVEPTCYYPYRLQGVNFSEFENLCTNYSVSPANVVVVNFASKKADFYMPEHCTIDDKMSTTSKMFLSPVETKSCPTTFSRMRSSTVSKSLLLTRPQINNFLAAILALKGEFYSMLQLTSTQQEGYGLMWYQEECPQYIYCINEMPIVLRVYNVNDSAEYTFCPVSLNSGEVVDDKCIFYSFTESPNYTISVARLIWYVSTVVICLFAGALLVYAAIRKFPNLLKGSKRILFVKHKNVDALILPPKVPLRSSLVNDEPVVNFDDKKIFILSDKHLSEFSKCSFVRSKSTRSSKSVAPSYISALQPTEEQLTEWRLRQHFDSDTSLTSGGLNVPYSLMSDDESMYCSIGVSSNNAYESLK